MASGKRTCTSLYTIKTQFFSVILIKDLTFQDDEGHFIFETLEEQVDLLNMTVNSALCQQFAPSSSYQQCFVKAILKKCEENNFEICDELYESYTMLIGKSNEVSEVCYKTYFISPDECITLQESTQMISHGTTGLCTWQAAKYLTEWAIENKQILKDKHVLELGSGLGLTGLVISKFCCPATYTFTDGHENVLRTLRKNVTLNTVQESYSENDDCCNIQKQRCDKTENDDNSYFVCSDTDGSRQDITRIKHLDWEAFTEQEVKDLRSDVILASDVVYDDRLLEPLVKVLSSLLSSSSVAYVSSTIRNDTTFSKFLDVLDTKSICWQEVKNVPTPVFYYNKDVAIKLLKLSSQ
ncbi:protein-lysine N-methyltransferase EEF2KMT-like [Antedon mediterranea]|uniref:protein-lysine N-methyltransferase EEF2KMT-like n=1 Tax=Antedon mediterranea TaxID=105859 RepID=UPI003AF7E943